MMSTAVKKHYSSDKWGTIVAHRIETEKINLLPQKREGWKLKIVMILNTTGGDKYLKMHILAIRSLRVTNPNKAIVTCIDECSMNELSDRVGDDIDLGDTLLIIKTPLGAGTFKNRWIKTQLRQLISGDFLYLDSDVVVLDDITLPKNSSYGVAAVRNTNGYDNLPTKGDIKNFSACNWRLPSFTLFNAGVWYLADTADAYNFSEYYHALWLESSVKYGISEDQHAFNKAIDVSAIRFVCLPDEYNIQEKYFIFFDKPKIWHFINSNADLRSTVWRCMLERTDRFSIHELIERNHPYNTNKILNRLVVLYASRRGNRQLSPALRLLLHGKKMKAFKVLIRDIARGFRISA